MKDLKPERGRSSAMEKKHKDGSQRALKERQKRPDMQLYVPRALRGTENKTVSERNANAENLNQQDGKKASEKPRATIHTDSLDNLPSVSSGHNHKKNSVNMHLKPKSIKNDLNNAIKLSCETVTECTTPLTLASKNVTENKTEIISSSSSPTEVGDPQNCPNSLSNCMQAVIPSELSCSENIGIVNNTNSPVSQNVEDVDKSINVEETPSNAEHIKKEVDCNMCTPCKSDNTTDCGSKLRGPSQNSPCVASKRDVNITKQTSKQTDNTTANLTVLENVSNGSLDAKCDLSSTATSDSSCYASDMDSLNISDKSVEADVSSKTTKSNNTPCKEKDDSWESMFNDDGECLDSNLVKELSSVTGKIQVRAAKNNYTDYQPLSESVPQEYENMVELYGFPREFVTQDLVSAFSVFQQSSFSIKWVDDCHALAIFTSPTLANQALQMKHPFMKVRPLSEGIKESKAKARWCAQHSEPQKPRPATSAVLARRLVSGALGLRVQATKEQRDHERSILKEAKEKRRQKAKQKEAIWDGSVI